MCTMSERLYGLYKRTFLLMFIMAAVIGCAGEETIALTSVAQSVQPTATVIPTALAETPLPEPTVMEVGEDEPTAAPTATVAPTDEPVPTVEPVAFSAEPRTVTFQTGDDLKLIGTFYPAGGTGPSPTVLLLHMLNGNREVWTELAAELNANGYNALALDMRGHGETGGGHDWELARADHLMVMNELTAFPEVDPLHNAIIGGSIGSNMALILGKDMPPLVKTVALLSPGLDYRGVTTDDAIGAYGDRPILMVASSEDGYSADSSRQLTQLALNGELIMYDGAGHGTEMLANQPELAQTLIDWLNAHISN